jgi:hypothetical protein
MHQGQPAARGGRCNRHRHLRGLVHETLCNVTLGLPDHSGLMLAASKRFMPRDNHLIDNLIRDLPWIISAVCPTLQTGACAPVSP